MSDVLVVSLGTTQGLRVADSLLVSMLREAGADTDAIRVRIGATNALRRGYPVNDLVEAVAARRALAGALRRGPRPARGGVLHHHGGDAGRHRRASLRRPAGFAGEPQPARRAQRPGASARAAESGPGPADPGPGRGRCRRAAGRQRAGRGGAGPGRPVGAQGEGRAGASTERDPDLAVAYVPDPRTKGLLRLCQAWATSGDRHLDVFGIDTAAARAWLDRHGETVPAGITFHGYVSAPVFRATVRRCRCYISAASWEDYGQAPLEALADGALLVTAPADGAYEALALARALDPDLVAGDLEPGSLTRSIEAAFARDDAACARYRARAAELLEPYGWRPAVETLRSRVLPALLERAGTRPRDPAQPLDGAQVQRPRVGVDAALQRPLGVDLPAGLGHRGTAGGVGGQRAHGGHDRSAVVGIDH